MAAGADGVDFDDDWYDPAPPPEPDVIDAHNVRFLPIGIGYEG